MFTRATPAPGVAVPTDFSTPIVLATPSSTATTVTYIDTTLQGIAPTDSYTAYRIGANGTQTSTAVVYNGEGHIGDADGDGSVSAADAAILLRYLAGVSNSIPKPHLADVNFIGSLTASDAASILRYLASIMPVFPAPQGAFGDGGRGGQQQPSRGGNDYSFRAETELFTWEPTLNYGIYLVHIYLDAADPQKGISALQISALLGDYTDCSVFSESGAGWYNTNNGIFRYALARSKAVPPPNGLPLITLYYIATDLTGSEELEFNITVEELEVCVAPGVYVIYGPELFSVISASIMADGT